MAKSTVCVLFVSLSLVYLLVQIPFLDRIPRIVVDEPWYANTAHNLATGHGLRTTVGGSAGDQAFLYPLVVSGAFRAFGTSLWVGRLVSALLGLIALWGWLVLCRKLAIRYWALVAAGALFVTSNVYFIIFRRLRPEALVLALSVWALYYFIEAWQARRSDAALACGLLAGASAWAHPNGALLAILFGILMIGQIVSDRCGARIFLGYCLGGFGVVVLFLLGWWLLGPTDLFALAKDLAASRRLSVTNTSFVAAFWTNLTNFIAAYSLGVKRLYILVFEFGILVVGLARYRRDRTTALLSLTGLLWFIIGLTLLTPFFRWAFSIVLMFCLAVTGRLLSPCASTLSPRGIKALWVFTLLYGFNTLAGNVYLVKENVANTSHDRLAEAIRASIPVGAPVLTPLEFWLAFHSFPEKSVYTSYSPDRFSALESGRVRYVVLSAALGGGRSPTTGELEYSADYGRFYQPVHAYVVTHGQRIALLQTRGYGEIEIWEIPASRCP